ncbi:MAG: M48 family metalloprotease [Armatimonadota bacterium]
MRAISTTFVLAVCVVFSCALSASALTLADEVRAGKQVMAEVRPLGLTEDRSLDAIGDRLKAEMHRKELTWRFWIVEDMKDFNAFAAPGGFVFITRIYYEKLSEDEAAFVIGHEMAHVDLRHYEKELGREQKANIGNLLLKVVAGGGGVWGAAADIGATAYMTHYSRTLERAADFAGYRYARDAGYNASAAVTALSKLGKEPSMHPWIANIYATHPILSVREDQLAALGGEAPKDLQPQPPATSHQRNLSAGLQPFDPPIPVAVRVTGADGKRWENHWRKSFTKQLHTHLLPLGFKIAGDDLMYKPDIGDPVAAARSRNARYLLLISVRDMQSASDGAEAPTGTPVRAKIDLTARLVDVACGGDAAPGTTVCREKKAIDVLLPDPDELYTDSAVGSLSDRAARKIAVAAAKGLGAKPAPPEQKAGASPEKKSDQESKP